MKSSLFLILFVMAGLVPVNLSYAAKSPIKGDPELVWLSPLGDDDIQNTPYNRCRLIKTLKPGVGKASTTTDNTYNILANYATNLYAQAIKISAYIEDEKNAKTNSKQPDLSNEVSLIENEITGRLVGISRRINIINSFEAGTEMLNNLQAITSMPPITYQTFRALVDGKYVYDSDCEALK